MTADATDCGEVGTGAGEGASGQDTGSAWVTRSADCPEAPAQAHLPADVTDPRAYEWPREGLEGGTERVPVLTEGEVSKLATSLRAVGFWATHADRWNDEPWQRELWHTLASATAPVVADVIARHTADLNTPCTDARCGNDVAPCTSRPCWIHEETP